MKTTNKQIEKIQTAFTFLPPPQRLQESAPDKLEVFEQTANTRLIVNRSDYTRWARHFETNLTGQGIKFETETGSFKLTIQLRPDDSAVFTLENLKDKSTLTARLHDDPEFLLDFRFCHNAMEEFSGHITKFNRPSSRVPCLVIEWKKATCEYSARNRELLPQILTAAAFGHLKHWWRTARRVQSLMLNSPPAGPRPVLNFSTGKTAPAAPGSAQ
jgi:hypothetical protein